MSEILVTPEIEEVYRLSTQLGRTIALNQSLHSRDFKEGNMDWSFSTTEGKLYGKNCLKGSKRIIDELCMDLAQLGFGNVAREIVANLEYHR